MLELFLENTKILYEFNGESRIGCLALNLLFCRFMIEVNLAYPKK
jgi:hypothetical protein